MTPIRTDGPKAAIEIAYKAMTAKQMGVSVEELEAMPVAEHPQNSRRWLFYAGWTAAIAHTRKKAA